MQSVQSVGRSARAFGVLWWLACAAAFVGTLTLAIVVDTDGRMQLGAASSAHAQIQVTTARIGCLDVQKSGNLTGVVARACDGKHSCNYKAPSPQQQQALGVTAKTRTFCTQAMEIKYHCGDRREKRAFVPGDAWGHPPTGLSCPTPGGQPAPRPHPAATRPPEPRVPGGNGISVQMARIGCLDIQTSGNLTSVVGGACNGRTTCSYKAPTPTQYAAMGVRAATRTFCTQAMEIEYRCPDGKSKSATVPGDAWKHGPARLECHTLPTATGKSIRITSARIGCLDIQTTGNLTDVVAQACTGKKFCEYKAPTPQQYAARGVEARTRSHCTQAMEINYDCGDGKSQRAFVNGDAWKHAPATLTCAGPCEALYPATGRASQRPNGTPKLSGWVDLHVHPMSHLGFGGKALHGAPDRGITMPAGTISCGENQDKVATNMSEALGQCNASHGGWGTDNTCGDHIRALLVNHGIDSGFKRGMSGVSNAHGDHHHAGHPDFDHWPHHSSLLHQQMWWEWIKRAYEGGLRVMVALTVNSETLAQILNGNKPYDDKTVADAQICATKRFVAQHSDFMEIAYSARDAERIVASNKLAVILGMEVDRIGNFQIGRTSTRAVQQELSRLDRLGIRYVFPVHLIDNAFGGAAVYEALFNMANRNINGDFFKVETSTDPRINLNASLIADAPHTENAIIGAVMPLMAALGNMPARCLNHVKCFPTGKLKCCERFERIKKLLKPSIDLDVYHATKRGHVNARGLTDLGEIAIKEMMKLGWIIDIDHMSEKSQREAVAIADGVEGDYPLVIGHNGIRRAPSELTVPADAGKGVSERSAPEDLVEAIARMGGMVGLGAAHVSPNSWAESYQRAKKHMPAPGSLAIGTDANGFEPLPHRYGQDDLESDRSLLQASTSVGSADFYKGFFAHQRAQLRTLGFGATSKQRKPNAKEWDYISEGGVAHYGLFPEFLYEVSTTTCRSSEIPEGASARCGPSVYDDFMKSAAYFVNMWQAIEGAKRNVR